MKKTSRVNKLHALVKNLGYSFKNEDLLNLALTHKSAHKECKTLGSKGHNERLEFLGDAVLSLVSAEYLYNYSENFSEGQLSQMRAQYVCRENLSKGAKELSIYNFIKSDRALRASGGTSFPSVLADTLEAVIGAVYIDGGLDEVRKVIFNILGKPKTNVQENNKDAKTKLQEIVQAKWSLSPKYKLMKTDGPLHAPKFFVGVLVNNNVVAKGFGENKKSAEQHAAHLALQFIEHNESIA